MVPTRPEEMSTVRRSETMRNWAMAFLKMEATLRRWSEASREDLVAALEAQCTTFFKALQIQLYLTRGWAPAQASEAVLARPLARARLFQSQETGKTPEAFRLREAGEKVAAQL